MALKKSAYLLPDREDTAEDFQWLLKEIESAGAEGWIFRTEAVAGTSDEALEALFRELRAADYAELLGEAQSIEAQVRSGRCEEETAGPESRLRKLRKQFEETTAIDFFDAPGKQGVIHLMEEIEDTLRQPDHRGETAATVETANRAVTASLEGRRWITRKGIKIDRTACCWLIRRFIDPAAEFSFVDPNRYRPREGEVRFDMFEGEFTHEGDRCSFEVLLDRCHLQTPALQAIAEVVHDLDLKDSKFGRPEAAGIAALVEGVGVRHSDDAQRLEAGLVIFDALHARLGRND